MQAWEAQKCPNCGNYDALVLLPDDTRHVTWDDHAGRKYEVQQYRCLPCASADLIKRDWNTDHDNDKPTKGAYSPGDGRMFIARPAEED